MNEIQRRDWLVVSLTTIKTENKADQDIGGGGKNVISNGKINKESLRSNEIKCQI